MTRATRIVDLSGSPTEIGESHGEALRELIHETATRWQGQVRAAGFEPEDLLVHLIDDSGFVRASYRRVPQIVEEIAGISRASGLDMRMTWALNLMDEEWWLREELTAERDAEHEHCSGFGVLPTEGQPSIIGQNMDLPSWLDGLQTLLRINPDGAPRLLAPSYPGMVATNAFNELGVGVCLNTLAQLPKRRDGVPVAVALRGAAARASVAEAVDFLTEIPHASGQNYIVGGRDTVVDLEASATGVAEYRDGPRFAHTNHPVAPGSAAPTEWLGDASSGHTAARFEAMYERLHQPQIVTAAAAFDMLREPPLCRGAGLDAGTTFYTVIWQPEARTLHLSAGSPDVHELIPYAL